MTQEIEFRAEKFKELVLYIAERSIEDSRFGATKLNKILFFSDFIAYAQYGDPITGAHYQRLPRGPAPRELLPIQTDMEKASEAVVVPQKRFNFIQKRLFPLRDPDLSSFLAQEIAVVDAVIDGFRGFDATNISALSHQLAIGWQLTDEGDDIPYESVFISNEPPTPTDIRRGQELAKEHGWLAPL